MNTQTPERARGQSHHMASTVASFLMRGRVALIWINKPPVNSLGHAVRKGIVDGLEMAKSQGAGAVVIAGDGATFPAGADITEFASGGHMKSPSLPEVVETLSAMPIHTIAAIHGTALGGGAEVTLACHHRLVHEKGKLGLPEVHLGILPGAGGTQRLPRLVGCEAAIQMMTTGKMVDAAAALEAGLADEIVASTGGGASAAEEVIERGVAYAEALLDSPVDPTRVVSAKPIPGDTSEAFFTAARAAVVKAAKGEVAPPTIVDAVRAAVDAPSYEAGVVREGELFAQLARGEQAGALQHVFAAERAMGKIASLPAGTPPRAVRSAVVIGAGTMGGGIAMCFAQAGVEVTILDASEDALARGLGVIRANYEASARKGKLSAAKVETLMARIGTASSYDAPALAAADVVVEAAFERMAIKKDIFASLDRVCKPGAVLATNTSTLDVDEIAAATSRPHDVVGMHFFSPANVMPLLENVRGAASSPTTLATAMALGKALRKKAVLVGNCFGFVGNRMLEPYVREALYLVEEGATPRQVDGVLQRFGMAMGPFAMSDLAGNDISYNIRKDRGWAAGAPALAGERYWAATADALVERGRLGQKAKAGWYDYSAGRTPVDDAEVTALIEGVSASLGIGRRAVHDDEILQRVFLPFVNEGFKIVQEGVAQRESDVDMVYLYGYGYPRWRGGPLYWARHGRPGGLKQVVHDLREYEQRHPDVSHWKPCDLLLKEAGL